jgi:transposase
VLGLPDRRRSVIVRTTDTGEVLQAVRITNSPLALAEVMTRAGKHPEVVLESCYGWYCAVDVLQDLASEPDVHLAHPLGIKAFEYRRHMDDYRDAVDLADLLRMGRCPKRGSPRPRFRNCASWSGTGFTAVQTIPGIGPVLAAVLVAELGDVHRIGTAERLGCWAAGPG